MPGAPKRVVICGGGVAALEALISVHAHVQVGVDVHMVAPTSEFVYRPLAVAAPFGRGEVQRFDLAQIASHHAAHLHLDTIERVDPEARAVELASGSTLPYDALLIAVGARPTEWLAGALHFGGADDVAAYRALLSRLESGVEQRVCFVNPPGLAWTLPLYELALLTASHLAEQGVIGTELVLVTPEEDPLAMFGSAASRTLRGLLADRGIALRAGTQAREIVGRELHLADGGSLPVERVVTLSKLTGPAIPGLPSDSEGFLPIDAHARVKGHTDVYAAGDGTDNPVKQGGIATQQADAAVEAMLASFGAAVVARPMRPTLRGMLLTGIAPLYLRAGAVNGRARTQQATIDPLWWPPSKIAARYLAPYLAGHDALSRAQELADRPAPSEDAARAAAAHEEARALAVAFAGRDAADGDLPSALEWLEVIERLDGALGPEFVAKRAEWHERLVA
ncbi:MAG TPA: FAD-dependent oxidoreductase [Solirubrobacteraceae bacterium]|nr:FAD-dependent oxidoreductase [Solirubrobacteraceae bacterium]